MRLFVKSHHLQRDVSFQIHWFSIFNSFMMVIFLVGLVSMILMRTLRKDYARYSKEDDLDDVVSSYLANSSKMLSRFFLMEAVFQHL